LKLTLDLEGIDDIAVVGQRQSSVMALDQDRLSIAKAAAAGGGVTGMADSQFTGKTVKVLLTESLSNQPHFGMNVDVLAVGGSNAGALLAPVLEGIQPKKG
jgi:hypothetical protein